MEDTEKQQEEQPKESTSSRAYKFIIGFVIALALLIFIISTIVLAVRIVPDTFALIAGVFKSTPQEQVDHDFSVSDNFVDSGNSVLFIWEDILENGNYSLTFLCDEDEGVSIEHDNDFIPCDKPLTLPTGSNRAEITLISKENRFLDIPVLLEFEKENGDIETIDEVQVTVSNKDPETGSVLGTEVEITSQQEEEFPSRPATVNLYTDLSVRILESGETNGIARIVFEVRNNGNRSTGTWSFQAILPVSDPNQRVFNSGLQNPIGPNGAIIYTMSLTGVQTGNALISVDNRNLVAESNESNNQALVSFNVRGNSSNFYGTGDADFDIDLIAIGRMSGSRFIETNNIDVRDELAIRFRVTNIGGRTTEDWRFEVDVDEPRGSSDLDYRSSRYNELDPGESRTITISFDNLDEDGDYDFEIEVDPERDTDEETRSNNRIRFDVDIDN